MKKITADILLGLTGFISLMELKPGSLSRLTSRKPTITFLVGLTCVGKSSLLYDILMDTSLEADPLIVRSTDNIIEDIANKEGITYDEFFSTMSSTPNGRFVDQVLPVLNADIENAVSNGFDVVVDMQNITKQSRALTYDNPKFKNYVRQAIVFDDDLLQAKDSVYLELVKKACATRAKTTNKTIPQHVIQKSFDTYESPTFDEGFMDIMHIRSLNPMIAGNVPPHPYRGRYKK